MAKLMSRDASRADTSLNPSDAEHFNHVTPDQLASLAATHIRFFVPALVAGAILLAALPVRAGTVTTLGALGANDSATWSQLGSPGDNINDPFSATSSGGVGISGAFGGAGGTVGQVCPAASCNYGPAAPGFTAGDFLIVTEDATGSPSGPLTFSFLTPVEGVGLYLQLDAPGTFTATMTVTGGSTGTETVMSDGSGDPVFLGALDATSDISKIMLAISSCTGTSPGTCSTSDFAVDTLFLTTATSISPEPPALLLLLSGLGCLCLIAPMRQLRRKSFASVTLLCGAGLILATASANAQDAVVPAGGALRGDGTLAIRDHALANPAARALVTPAIPAAALPIWTYQVTSPIDGNTYTGYSVGTSPFTRLARSTTIPVVLIPMIVTFHNTTSGFMATFDPTSTPDPGCTANETAMSVVEGSPVFENLPWTMNGVNVGTTQYIDAYMRASYWQYVQNTGNAYHVKLSYTLGAPATLAVNYSTATLDHEVEAVSPGTCTNPTASGATNASGYTGVVSIDTMDAALRAYVTAHGITANQFPLFILYNVVMSLPDNPGFFDGGYHASEVPYPAALTSPGQTYAIAGLQLNQFFSNPNLNSGTSILSHEVGEWMNNPGIYNLTPAWGNIGQVTGCQNNLEVGDALTGTNLPPILESGFSYNMQELVFYSWFFRTPSIGAGGLFSDNGTFTSDAGPVCM